MTVSLRGVFPLLVFNTLDLMKSWPRWDELVRSEARIGQCAHHPLWCAHRRRDTHLVVRRRGSYMSSRGGVRPGSAGGDKRLRSSPWCYR